MTTRVRLCALCAVIVITAEAGRFVSATQKQTFKRVVSERKFYLKDKDRVVVLPIRIHDLTIDGQQRALGPAIGPTGDGIEKMPVEPDAIFDAEDNSFIERIRFRVTNQSKKNIKYIRFNIHFFTLDRRLSTDNTVVIAGPDLVATLYFGRYPMPKESSDKAPLEPGQTVTMAIDSMPEDRLKAMRFDISQLKKEILRVAIHTDRVTFEDGSECVDA